MCREAGLQVVPAAGGVDHDRSQECHRGVEVEHRRDGHDQDGSADIEHAAAPPGPPGEGAARPLEQTVFVGHHPDQEQAGNQDEGGPVLGRRRGRLVRVVQRRGQGGDGAQSREAPLERGRGGGGDRRRAR